MIKTLGRGLLGGMSKNEQIQFFDSQIYLFASNLNMVEYTGLGKNSRKILERQTPYESIEIREDVSLKLIVKN